MDAISTDMLKDLKDYARVDGTYSDGQFNALYKSAVKFCERMTGKKFITNNNQPIDDVYWLVIKMIVLHWYSNPGIVETKQINEIPFAAKVIISQISFGSEYEEVI